MIRQVWSSQGRSCTRMSLCQYAAAGAVVRVRLPHLDPGLYPFGGITEAFRKSLRSQKLLCAVPFPPAASVELI